MVTRTGPRVLVADDSPLQRKLHEFYAQQLGCEVVCRSTGREALQDFLAGNFDLVLMDCDMPHMDGLEATRQIRLHEASSQACPVTIIGITDSSSLAACIEAGMDYSLSKRNLEELIPLMRLLLPKKDTT